MISPRASLPALRRSLTTRLLLWTAAFVMLAEVLIYVPSIARFRQTYLRDLMADAHLATLALDAAAGSNAAMSPELVQQLLGHAKVVAVIRYQAGFPRRVALGDVPESVAKVYDFRGETLFGLIWDAFETLAAGGNRAIRVVGLSPQEEGVLLELFLTDTRLKAEMIAYSWRILVLSVIISLIAAVLVYLSLHWLLVRPLRRLTENMAVFRDGPEDTQRLMRPSARGDEIGFAERELRSMQIGLRAALRQRAHLAALGTAVTKINHDLRNALSSAQLVSDRLTDSADPQVRRVAPTLVRSIDRAVDLCTQTLEFARGQEHQLAIEPLDLRTIADEVFQGLAPGFKAATLVNAVPAGFTLQADRVQFERVLINLVRNALQAGALTVTVSAARDGRAVVEVTDDGPGLPPALRERLFEPFATGRKGGIGLGLAIVRDLVEAHGGFVRLLPSERGAHFRIELPRG